MKFHRIWVEQCDAAEGIAENFGAEQALRYLVGEKYLRFLEIADKDDDFAAELPAFTRRILKNFGRGELGAFFADIHRRATAGEGLHDWPLDPLEDSDMDPSEIVREAERVVLIERARELLLEDSAAEDE